MNASHIATLRRWASEAGAHECCGLLLGESANSIDSLMRADNVSADPRRAFEIDPATLIACQKAAREGGPQLVGYYHSHPTGNPAPSATDARLAQPDGRVWLIIGGDKILGWRAVENGEVEGRFVPVELDIH